MAKRRFGVLTRNPKMKTIDITTVLNVNEHGVI